MLRSGLLTLLAGTLIGLLMGAAAVYVLIMTGNIAVFDMMPGLASALGWIKENLGSSIPFFLITLLSFLWTERKIARALELPDPPVQRILDLNQTLNTLVGLFFGIGVIWTAIGMRGALIEALGNLDAQTAAQQGAWSILKRLVDGGVLVALSTTIVGGIGGYCMRLYKAATVGPKINRLLNRPTEETKKIIKTLEEIRDSLRPGPTAP